MIKPTILVILDGWGVNTEERGNAIAQARTPNVDELDRVFPNCILQASSLSVGLPWGKPGNSEVGHLTLGAGRIIYHDIVRINLAIQDKTFFKNPAILKAVGHVKKHKSALHLIGLLSSASIHSYIDHLYELLELAQAHVLKKVFIHLFTDGRDSLPHEALTFIENLAMRLTSPYIEKIASIQGRYYGMDRNKNWQRTKKAYELLVAGAGKVSLDPAEAIEDSYQRGVTDEFIKPTLIKLKVKSEKLKVNEVVTIKDNDAVVFFNFRADRARQLTQAFVEKGFRGFKRRKVPKNLCFVTMTEYKKGLPAHVAFPPQEVRWPLARVISEARQLPGEAGLKQLHIAETEKYAHVTYFFNGGREKPFKDEERILIPSPSVSHYDKTPEMSALKITRRVIEEIKKEKYHFIIMNYANGDMLGHTGNFSAAVKAIEHVDSCLGQLIKEVFEKKGLLVITADHGNVEQMLNLKTGEVLTEHSDNPVPFWLVGTRFRKKKNQTKTKEQKETAQGILADVAPTILELMNLEKPEEMTGESLLPTLLGD